MDDSAQPAGAEAAAADHAKAEAATAGQIERASALTWHGVIHMRKFRFQILEMKGTSPREWLRMWSARFPFTDVDEKEHADLVAKYKSFSA